MLEFMAVEARVIATVGRSGGVQNYELQFWRYSLPLLSVMAMMENLCRLACLCETTELTVPGRHLPWQMRLIAGLLMRSRGRLRNDLVGLVAGEMIVSNL